MGRWEFVDLLPRLIKIQQEFPLQIDSILSWPTSRMKDSIDG